MGNKRNKVVKAQENFSYKAIFNPKAINICFAPSREENEDNDTNEIFYRYTPSARFYNDED